MYSKTSRDKLNTCHPLLIKIFTEVIKTFDHTILEGTRDEATQNKYFEQGLTKVKYPNSKHNSNPSMAVDAVPYPINWIDKYRMAIFIGYVLAIAHPILEATDYKLVSGIDWDNDSFTQDHSFLDFPHFQLELR